ncbi:NRDE family protein [Paucisalibacillus sp. EB02]|uniref:NRDE family protein n=1 Tax=Paucisalibacillus sp. EB02 TaxID=1347087 RepID=UPI0005AA2BF4|nr:NRDE family protein [Paucisalibacillus sp. EB02]
MCLILFQLHEHPNYKLILAANRDEAYNRPTAQASFWQDKPHILAGRDLVQMGTWLGVSSSGRFAALTNYRHPAHMKPSIKSRGEIVTNYLAGSESAHEFLQKLEQQKAIYVGYNVLVGNPNELIYYNNIEDEITPIKPGTHGLSNHFLNTPWPKVEIGKKRLRSYLKQTKQVDSEELFKILADTEESTEELLPDTGIGLTLEKKLSPLFIKLPDYGTRCSTVLTIDQDNNVSFTERTFLAGEFVDEVNYNFLLSN